MQWIKRNLFLVVGVVVALGLLGVAGFYLYTKIQQDNAVTDELNNATQKLESLAKRDPYPSPENINAAKDEGKRLQGFLGDLEKHFQPADYPKELNNMEFRTYLDITRAGLLEDARRAGVEIPTNYWFTFAAQKGAMSFSSTTLQPLASQLADIRSLCGVLFDAKVNSLVWLKRVPVDSADSVGSGSQDYLNTKATTNNWAVTVPYEVAFQGFSSELAAVLEGLTKLPQCFVVTNIVSEPAAAAGSGDDTQSEYNRSMMSRYGVRPPAQDVADQMRARYGSGGGGGMGGRYGGRGGRGGSAPVIVNQQAARPAAPRGPTTFLEEKPLRFILEVQAIRLKQLK